MKLNIRCFNPQFFIASRLGDVALDQEVKLRTGSFESQMRIVIRALIVLSAAIPTGELRPTDRLALDQLKAIGRRAGTDGWSQAVDVPFTSGDVDDLIQRLRLLRQTDPESARQILRRLVEEVGADAESGRS